MVSSVNILQAYYHIPLKDQMFFTYKGENYYLSNNIYICKNYNLYLMITKQPEFRIVENIYHQYVSQDHILYKYIENYVSLDMYYYSSFKIVKSVGVSGIKQSWIKLLEDVKNCFSSINKQHTNMTVYHYYYYYLGFLAIEMLNYYFDCHEYIDVGFQHNICSFDSKTYMNPDNLKLTAIGEDLITLYLNNLISLKELDSYFQKNILVSKQYAILLCKAFFPINYYRQILMNSWDQQHLYQYLTCQLQHQIELYHYIKKYIDVPSIYWI